jgi:predicted dienelactone hydrolase
LQIDWIGLELVRTFQLLRRLILPAFTLLCLTAPAFADDPPYVAGMTQVQFRDPSDGTRPVNVLLIYPAVRRGSEKLAALPYAANLQLFLDATPAPGDAHPLVVFSHGAGGNPTGYAWFGQFLAERGFLVAMPYHYRANTFDSSALYVRNRLWRRPLDISLIITHLVNDPAWAPRIAPNQIAVAGHSQGGFTALWIGGATVNPGLFEAFQRGWKSNYALPAYLRDQMDIDAAPTRHVRDNRVKAAFAMAPGDIKGFGMDAMGLARMKIPAYLIVGANDTTTPSADNAAFAAQFIPDAHLDVLAGPVGHEIFGNECDQVGRDNFPDACIDPPGVDRAKLHVYIAEAAVKFFNHAFGVAP